MTVMMDFRLTEFERKLLRLALDRAARGAEVTTSAVKLIQSLRNRGVESLAVETALDNDSDSHEIEISKPDWGLTMVPWGKYRGEMFSDIPPSYLRWARRWILEDEERTERFEDLAEAIEQFLDQTS